MAANVGLALATGGMGNLARTGGTVARWGYRGVKAFTVAQDAMDAGRAVYYAAQGEWGKAGLHALGALIGGVGHVYDAWKAGKAVGAASTGGRSVDDALTKLGVDAKDVASFKTGKRVDGQYSVSEVHNDYVLLETWQRSDTLTLLVREISNDGKTNLRMIDDVLTKGRELAKATGANNFDVIAEEVINSRLRGILARRGAEDIGGGSFLWRPGLGE